MLFHCLDSVGMETLASADRLEALEDAVTPLEQVLGARWVQSSVRRKAQSVLRLVMFLFAAAILSIASRLM